MKKDMTPLAQNIRKETAKEIFKELDPYFKNHIVKLKLIDDYPKIKKKWIARRD